MPTFQHNLIPNEARKTQNTHNMFSMTGNEMNKKRKTKVMQNLGRGNKVYYGRCANGECHELYPVQKQLWVTSGKDFFLKLLNCLQPSSFVFQHFFLDSRSGRKYPYKVRGGWTGSLPHLPHSCAFSAHFARFFKRFF